MRTISKARNSLTVSCRPPSRYHTLPTSSQDLYRRKRYLEHEHENAIHISLGKGWIKENQLSTVVVHGTAIILISSLIRQRIRVGKCGSRQVLKHQFSVGVRNRLHSPPWRQSERRILAVHKCFGANKERVNIISPLALRCVFGLEATLRPLRYAKVSKLPGAWSLELEAV